VADEATWGIANLIFFVAAIGIHLLFNELFLVRHFSAEHNRRWRVALSMAPLFGCGFAVGAGMPSGALYIALALVAGATITTIFQRELLGLDASEQCRSSPVLAYAGLIFATWRF
jgi:hypothetical protein